MDVEKFRDVYLKRLNPVLDQSRSKTNIPQLMEVNFFFIFNAATRLPSYGLKREVDSIGWATF